MTEKQKKASSREEEGSASRLGVQQQNIATESLLYRRRSRSNIEDGEQCYEGRSIGDGSTKGTSANWQQEKTSVVPQSWTEGSQC